MANDKSTQDYNKHDEVLVNQFFSDLLYSYSSEVKADIRLSFTTHVVNRDTIVTNVEMVKKMVEHLIHNAIKFTQPAEGHLKQAENHQKENVTLTVEATEDKVIFLIENTGITIPAKDAERIFDEFVQLDEYYNGTGIGLTVARSLARRLGGDIVLDTTYKEGARFVTTLKR